MKHLVLTAPLLIVLSGCSSKGTSSAGPIQRPTPSSGDPAAVSTAGVPAARPDRHTQQIDASELGGFKAFVAGSTPVSQLIVVHYSNPDGWAGDISYNRSSRDHLMAICWDTKQTISSSLEADHKHATLVLPAATCQLRATNGDAHYHAYTLTTQNDCHSPVPQLDPNAKPGTVIELGEALPKCTKN